MQFLFITLGASSEAMTRIHWVYSTNIDNSICFHYYITSQVVILRKMHGRPWQLTSTLSESDDIPTFEQFPRIDRIPICAGQYDASDVTVLQWWPPMRLDTTLAWLRSYFLGNISKVFAASSCPGRELSNWFLLFQPNDQRSLFPEKMFVCRVCHSCGHWLFEKRQLMPWWLWWNRSRNNPVGSITVSAR